MMEKRICITGEMRSGKTTAADYLELNHFAMPFAFGDDLKEDFHREYPQVPKFPKPRKGYQLYGQFMRYIHGEDYWLNKCFDKINRTKKVVKMYGEEEAKALVPMITDARQPNEFGVCREKGFVIIKIVAPEEVRIQRAKESGDNFKVEDLYHETETHIKDVVADYTIFNNGTVEELYTKLDKVMRIIDSKYGADALK